jgi:G:T-mismatch repair DNA endonuclease (very short patch repair protein)
MVTVTDRWYEKYKRDGSRRRKKKQRLESVDYYFVAVQVCTLFIAFVVLACVFAVVGGATP